MPALQLPGICLNALQLPKAPSAHADADIVMIHGLATSLAFWFGIASSMFTRLGRVTLYDLRGHGYSEMPEHGYSAKTLAKDLERLLDHFNINSAHIVAHSFGGMIALCFALLHPERVKSLVLADVRIWSVDRASAFRRGPHVRRLREAGLKLDDSSTDLGIQVLTELARLKLSRPKAAAAISHILTSSPNVMGQRNAQRWLTLLSNTFAYADITGGDNFTARDLRKLTQPVLAVYGENSSALRSARALQRSIPTCNVQIVPGAGHFFPLTRPKLFAETAAAFLSPLIDDNVVECNAIAPQTGSAPLARHFLPQA